MDTCVDDAITHLSYMENQPELQLHNSMVILFQSEFRFFRVFLLCFPGWDCDANLQVNLSFLVTSIADLVKIERIDSDEIYTKWYSVVKKVFDKIKGCKADAKKYRQQLISCSSNAEPYTSLETMQFLDYVLVNINNLVKCQVDVFLETLEERVFLLRNLVYFKAVSGENWEESFGFEFQVNSWTNKAACLTLLHWLNDTKDEEIGEKLKCLHIDLLKNFNPCNSEFIRRWFEIIKGPKLKGSDKLVFGEFVSRFVDFFLENIVLLLKDDVRLIREGLILLINFLADPPATTELSFISRKIYAVFDQASHTICVFCEINFDLAKGKTTLDNLQKSIDEVKCEVEKIFIDIPRSSWSNFPRTNGFGYFEFLLVYLENLKETMNKNKRLVPFLKDSIFRIQEKLLPLRSFLQGISIMQNEHKELNDLREQIIDLSYQADLAIKSSFFVDYPIWYNLTRLSFIVKDIQCKTMKIVGTHIHKSEDICPMMNLVDVVKGPTSSSIAEVVVGFKQEIKVLMNCLIRGTEQLDIVSIVGMGGIGKTTLAKKLFNEPLVTQHFHVRALCSFSQNYVKRNVLLEILKDSCQLSDYELQQMSDNDLSFKLYKSLKRRRFLIVVDDIWDIDAWNDIKQSFPDDNIGSRIIFTTRIDNISSKAKSDNASYLLPFLSIDESWELLQRKIFHEDPCPSHLYEVGKLIAKKCRGLPLAIILIAGLLARTERSVSQWNEVAENLNTFASNEGCKDVIKLSYVKLPEALKSCFLYLGAFREDEILEAERLILLWIAEGFVLKSSNSCLRKDARKYLKGLGDMNLITVVKRSLNGGIKSFRVHDLIHDFCRAQAQEEHSLCFFINADNNNLSMLQYRICLEAEWRSFVNAKPPCPTVHSLLYFFKEYREENSLQSFFHNFNLIQLLDLREVEIVGEFPTIVTTLIHLRYLTLRFFTAPYVPPELTNLWNLETFLLLGGPRRSNPIHWIETIIKDPHSYHADPIFSNTIWKMKRLRHVESEFRRAEVALDDITGVSSQLLDLETFISLYIPSGKNGDELLRRLPNVRKLSCCFDAYRLPPKLEILTKLKSLTMILDNDQICHAEMFSFPSTIRKLTLQNSHIPWNEISAVIEKLPCLHALTLYDNAFIGKTWDVKDEEFPNIKSLTLINLDLEEWIVDTYSFPSLEKLKIGRCHSLKEIPSCFGETPTLKSISVVLCENGVVDSANQIKKEQLDSGNQSFETQLVLISQYDEI